MDWASSQWKEGLSSIALQKISALEEKIEKLQKERQQKQHQFDCLELTLNKEKRKVGEEKQQTVRLERELQSLSDACKSFESKQQKFLADIQNRDSRINNLESQLSQAKKQNSRLQQLENDIEELRCLKESAKLETRQLEEKLIKEQDTIVKQSDAISDLEQTVRSLQEKCSNTENSVLLNVTDKENINILNISSKDNLASESLRKKILEQENTIKSLQEELTRLSGSKEKVSISINDSFVTPVKGKNTSRDIPISSAKKSFSLWDNFGSTPAKSGKLTRHISDSSSFDNESDEKVHSLQLKLKQMCQELECQRHNFEATKNVMEQKFKEKENALKSEVKQQSQTIFDLDKELKELKNKYQQDVVQGSKKLDIVNMQLQKNELSKQQMEKDLKALEIQMNSRNSSLLQKEEELKDVLKLKNSLEATTKSLQSEKRELEKNCATLVSQKNSLSEEIRDLKVHLDGSSNLVKEKESVISNMKKEQSSFLKIKSDLENKINSLNKDLSSLQSEKSVFEKQLQELYAEISVMANNLESVKEEKKTMSSTLDFEKSKSEKLKSDLDNKEKELITLQSEIKSNELNIMSLKTELEQLTGDYNVKIKDMEQKLFTSNEEISHLKNEVQTHSDNKKVLEENITELRKENVRISDLFTSKESECESFRKQIENLDSELQSVQSDNTTKHENICLLEEKIKSIDEAYNKQLIELKDTLCILKSEKADFETLLKDYKINEESLKATIAKAETKEKDLSELLAVEKEKNKELDSEFQNLQMELNSKYKELTELKDTICLLKSEKADFEILLKDYNTNEESLKASIAKTETEKHNLSELLTAEVEKKKELDTELSDLKVTVQNLQMELNSKASNISDMNESLCAIKSEKSALEKDLKNLADKEKTLENNLIQIETDKQNLLDLLNKEKVKSEALQLSVTELENKISDQQEELTAKDSSVSDLNKYVEELKANIHELNERLCATKSEKSAFENDLKNLAEKAKTLENNLIQLETDKQNLLDLLNKEKVKSEALQFSLVELEKKISDQQEELTAKDLSVSDLNKYVEELKANIHELNESLCAVNSEKSALENDLKNLAEKEKTLENYLVQTKTDKQNLLDLLSKEKVKSETLEFSQVELEKKIRDQQEELIAKDLSVNDLNKHIEELKANILELNESLYAVKSEKFALENDLQNLAVKEKTLENNLIQIETDKQKLSDLLNGEKVKSETLQFSLLEFEKKISDQQKELTAKDLTISDLNKHTEELKENMSEMNETVSSIKSETELLQKNLKACAVSEESLQKKLLQSEKERKKISELLSGEEEKCRLYEMSISDMEKKLNNLQTELDAKDSVIGELNKNIDEFKDLEYSIDKGNSLEEKIQKLEAEKQEFIDLLKEVKKESGNFQSNLEKSKEEIHKLQTELNIKNSTIDVLNKTTEELKVKTCEIIENIDVIKSEKISLQKNLENCLKTEEELQKSLKQAEAEKQNMLELLNTEQKQTEKFQLEITELKNQINDMEEHFKVKDLTILDLTERIECHKAKLSDMDEIISIVNSEKTCLENSLKDCALREKSLQNDLQVFESDKQNLSEQLTAEKERSEELHLLVSELAKKVDNQQADLNLKETTIDDQNKNTEELKIKVCNLTEDIASLKSERLVVENELNEMTLKMESLKKNLLQMESEKDRIDEQLTAEKSKSETLELSLAETKLKLDSFHDELDSKNMNMELINKKLEELKHNEDHLQNLESQLVVFREKEISLNEKINQLEEEKTVSFESLSIERNKNLVLEANISEFQVKVANLESELKTTNENFSSITSDIAHSKETYELKLREFETALEVMKSQNDNLSNQIKDFIETETALKETMKMIEAEKETMSENLLCEIKKAEELKANLSTRESEICNRDKIICNLKTEIEDLRRMYEEEKHNLVIHIGDIKYNLLSMQDSVKSIYSENDRIQSDMNNLKQECQELLTQKACAQQSKEEFLFSLLNQLGVIEKHVEALEENYEENISFLKTALSNAELKIALQAEDYVILINEKDQLQNELISNQENIYKKDMELKRAVILEDEHLKCLKDIEDLKETREHLFQENYQLQSQISDLTQKMEEISLIADEQVEEIGMLKNENSKLLEELKTTQDLLQERETELADVTLLVKEHINCSRDVENLMEAKESLTQENYQLLAQISDLTQKMEEISLIVDERVEEIGILKNEKSKLLEELKTTQDLLQEKETELADVSLLVKEHINCSEAVKNLMEAKESLTQENHQLLSQISDLTQKMEEISLIAGEQVEEIGMLKNEKSKLLEELKTTQDLLQERETELADVTLLVKEHINCSKDVENLMEAKESLTQENYQLLAQISDLTQKMEEISLIADERVEEIGMLKNEKSKLLEELKTTQDLLQEKETELADVSLLVKEHINCSETVKNLMEAKESFTQENHQLLKQVSNLQVDLSKAELKIVNQNKECGIHLEERSNLLNELKMLQEQLCDKETALKNAILIENEHTNCHKIVENLANANKVLTEKNDQLQEQICDLKKILAEADSKTSIKNEELDILTEEKISLLEELKIIKENLCLKEKDCDNLTARKINLCQENTKLLTEISSVSQDLHIAKERLSFLDNKLKSILLKCKDVLSSVKDHGGQKDEISLDLMNTMSSYGLIENKVMTQGQQMENMCDLVCRCLELLKEYIFVQSSKLEIPIQVAEIGNQYFQGKDVETSNNYSMHYDGDVNHFPTDCQNLQTNIAKDLTALSTDVYTLICSFEERVLNQKDKFKFLMHHQLVECTDFQKMLLILKFMKNVYSKVSYRKFALQELKDIKICLLSQNQLPPKMASVLNSFSSDFKEDNDVNLFFEKFLLINAYKNIYMAHRLKKALYFVKDQLNMYSERFEKHERYLITYQNIHKHPSHMPILTQLKYKIYLNGLSSLGCREKLNGEISCLNINREQLFSINSILCNVKASTVPLILNCMFEFYENNCSSSVYKNLVHLIMKVLQSCCLKEVSFLSSNTIKTVDDFLLLVSSQNSSAFKNVVIRNQMRALGDLISSLLGDLSSIKHLAFSGEQELQKNRNVLSEISDQLNKLKFDHECKQRDLDLLRALLQEEKDRQQNLPTLTKTDCDVLLSQKEKLEQTVLEISKLCSVLKNIFSENCNVLNLQTEIATLSDTFCLCQTCLNTLEKAEEGQCNHVLFSPVTLIHFIAELFNSKSDLEKEVMKLEECKSAIKHDIMQLENDKSLLQHTIDDLEGNISTLEHELSNFKSKYSVLENEYQNINSLYIESNKEKEDQQNCLKANMEEIRNCKRQYEGLLTECQKMKNDLMEKEEEILNYEKTIQNKASQYETLDIKCKSYESEIENLNATITKLTDMKQKESGEINNSLVKEMKNKIASLEKSNNLLNMTVETVEEELQTVYEEKQNIQKDLQEKLDEVENLQQEIASWKNKIAEENNEVSCLKHTIQNLTKEVEDTVAKCTELLNKNSKLQSDVTLLEQNIKTYEKCIVEKDSSLEENIRIVNKLREEILIITNEKKNIQIKIEETEANLHLELQKKNTLLYDFEKKLNQILNEKADLEKQISCLLLSEEERKKLLLEKESSGLKIKELIEEIGLLRSKLENFELQAIFDKKEKEKAFQTIQNINFENEEYTKKLEKLKNELSAVKESNIESSVLIQQLQKELDSLKECKSTQLAKGSTLSDISQDHSSTECKGNCSVSELTVTKSEHDYKQYVTKIINVFITVLQDTEYGDDNHKTDLISMLSKWESNIINPRHFSEIKVKLQSVLDFQFGKLQELESELYNLKNLICKLTTELKQYCEGAEQKVKCNINLLGNKSCFEESLCVSPAKYQTYFVLNSYIGDLKSSFNMLELCFKSMKNIIINKDLEINSLKERCQDKVKGEIKTMQNEQKDDYLIMKNKCKLLISNAYRLEKDYNKLKQTNEELENRIKILEQEKLELNEEADEMAEIIKQQNYSEELENLYRKVAETSDELCELKEKNKCLRAMLEQYEDAFKEHGINISSAQNLAQDANALQ